MNNKTYWITTLMVIISLTINITELRAQNYSKAEIESFNRIFLPDDSLSVNQKDLKTKINRLMIDNIDLVNGHLATSLNKKDFKKKKIPNYYYSMLMKNIEEFNLYIDKNNIIITDEILDKLKNEESVSLKYTK